MKIPINRRNWRRIAQGLAVMLGLAVGHLRTLAQTPTNDDFANATVLSGINILVNGTTLNATAEPGEPAHAGYPAAHSIWYAWTAPANGSVQIDLTGSAPGTDVSVFVGKYLTNLSSIASNAGGNSDQTGRCIFQAAAGVLYEVAVDVTSGSGGSVQLSLIFTTSVFPPQITQQPSDQSVVQGGNAIFSVVAAGGGALFYQWFFNGINGDKTNMLAGATNANLQLQGVTTNQAGYYSVSVSNLGGSTNSREALLTVILRPPNDDFANRIVLSGTNITTTSSDQYATLETGEPNGGWSAAHSVWWTWTAPATGIATVAVTNFTGDQVLSIYTGNSLTNLQLVTSSAWYNIPLAVQFVVATGTTYQIAVDGVVGTEGNLELDLNFTATNFPPMIVQQPTNQTVMEGGNATFQVVASSALPCAFQWLFNNTNIAGATNVSLVLTNVMPNQAGTYQVRVGNASGAVLSSPASLVVNVPPLNDNFANRIPISGLNFTTTGSNQFATAEPGEPRHAGDAPNNSVWWSWTTPSIGEASVNVTGFSGAETLAIYTGTNLTQLTGMASNAWNAGPLAAHFAAAAGTTYQIAVSDPKGVGGTFQLQVQLAISNFPPRIPQQLPPVTNVIAGTNFQFLIYVTNVYFAMTNLWYFQPVGGTAELIGGWGSGGGGGGWGGGGGDGLGDGGWDLTLNLTNMDTNQTGYYYTVITTIGGSVTSSNVFLVVHFPPSNDNFTNRIMLTGVNLTAIGTTAYATLESGEPPYPGLASGGSVWWSWTAPDAGTVYLSVTNTNAAFQVLQIYTGGTLSNLVSIAEVGGSQYVLSKSFITTGGTTYQIAVAGGESTIELGLQFQDATIPPQIIQQPANVTVAAGGSAFFQVGAAGGGTLFYQWFFNGFNNDQTNVLAGATNANLQLNGVTTNQGGYYSVSVSNLGGSVPSSHALLTVTLRPPNDDFANRIVLSGTNLTTTGSDQYATSESGEPAQFGAAKSVWWSWTAPSDGLVNISLTNYTGNQILAIYTGSSLLSLSGLATALFYQVLPLQPIAVQFNTTAGTTCQIQVEEPINDPGGSFSLNLLFTQLIFPPIITSQPLSRIVTNGDSITLQVVATGAPPLAYQWLFGGTNLAGATNNTLELDNVTTSEAGSYLVIVSNPGGSTNSQPATLFVRQRPPNDFFTNSIALTGAGVSVTGSNSYASAEPGEPAHAGYGPFTTVWWNYTPTNFGLIHMDLTNSFYGADMAVYTGTNMQQLTLVSSNAFGNADGTAQLTFLGQAGVTYQIAVQGALPGNYPSSGNISLLVEELLPPTIDVQPADQYVGQGENAIFAVQASSLSPMTYQWQFGGAALAGETNATLVVQNVQPGQEGNYSVVVGNAVGNVQSSNATLYLVAVLTGQVTDATTGDPLPGVQITVATNVTYTDSSGNYRIANVTSTGVTVDFTADTLVGLAPLTVHFSDLTSFAGAQLVAITNYYANYTNDNLEVSAEQIVTNSFSMSPLLPSGGMRFVLNWGAQPRDLDGQLLTPPINGTNYHVYYPPEYRGRLVSPPFAQLNQDATNGFGPETITIAQFFPGAYRYYVHKFAGVGDLSVSSATVAIYTTAGLVASFAVPTNQPGDYWYVCNVDGATKVISPVDDVQTVEPSLAAVLPSAFGLKIPNPTPVAFPNVPGSTPTASPNTPGSTPASFLWDFGDGTTSQNENPVKTYANPGLYSVSLTVLANGATNTLLKSNYIQVLASTPPTVSIITPLDGALFSVGALVTITAGVTNGSGSVTNVLFYAGQTLLGTAGQSPFSFVWTNAPAGTNILTAAAYANDGLASTSAPVNIIVDIPPVITTQPQSQTVIQGSNVTFSVTAAGTTPLSYQWQFNSNNLSGATNATLMLLNVQINQSGTYAVVVTNVVGPTTSSNVFLTVEFPPTITRFTNWGTNIVGATYFFSVTATGSLPLFYEWLFNGTYLPGATNTTLTLTNLQVTNAGSYSVVVSNLAGSTNSATAVLTVNVPPTITQQPTGVTTNQGAPVAFTVTATGSSPLSYHWQFNGTNLSGATNATLTVTNVQTNQAGPYAVVVTNVAGSITSSNALLTVIVPPSITQQPASVTTNQGAMVMLAVGAIGTAPLTYQWQFNGTNLPGADAPIIEFFNILPYQAGIYTAIVSNAAGVAISSNAILRILVPPAITNQPASIIINQGANVAFTVGATGSPPLSYQWQFNSNNLSGATNATLTLTNVQTNQAGTYAIIVSNMAGSTNSSNAVLTVNGPPVITQQPISVTTNQGANVAFNVTATGTAPLAYQWRFNGTSIPSATNSTLTLAAVQSTNAGPYSVVVSNVAGSTTSSNAVLTVNAPPAITQQPGSVITNQGADVAFTVSATGSPPLSYQWQFNSNNLSGATNATLTLTNVQTNQAGTYAVVVSNVAGSTDSSNAVLTVKVPPAITQQPISVTTNQGANVAFNVTATGTAPLAYQWRFNGTSIPNATNSTLNLVAVQSTNAGPYSVVVSNVAGSTNSSTAVLTVNVPPTITQQPASITTNQGANVAFNVTATGSPPLSYQWQFNSNNLSGATNATLTLANVQTNQSGTYAVVVTNVAGSTTSSNAVLVVVLPLSNPVITLVSPANQAAFCTNVPIPLLASVSNAVSPPTSVAFYAGSTTLLGRVTNAPYSFSWTGVSQGDYSLTATATFADGSTVTSSPALIAVSAQCGQVAIVRNYADPEIGLLQSNLFVMGLSSQVFDQAGLTATALAGYELVIWDGVGGATNCITDNTVSVLASLFVSGRPLYLIGENLASDTAQLDEPQLSQWIQLTSLTPSNDKGGDGSVEISGAVPSTFFRAYGTVSNFVAPTNFDVTTLANANASILGQSGTTVVLAAFQGTNATQTRIVTQNFKVGGGADPNALAQRYTLFLDAVCWLVRCQACSDVGLGLGSSVTPNPAALGQAVTYQWVVGNNGRCEGTGTVLTSLLPAGAQFVSAEAQFGTWEYNTNLGAVIFQIGLLPQGPTRVSFTVIPWQPGTLTNTTEVSANAVPPNTNQVVTVVIGLELNLEWTGGTNYLLQLFGNEGLNYEIQTSTNLPQWTDWTNVPGPAWATPLTDPLHTNFPWRFYRALSQ